MSYTSKVTVQYRSGSKAQGIKVQLAFTGLGGVTSASYTDRNGIALISHASRGSAKLIVKGSTRTTMQAPFETVVFI